MAHANTAHPSGQERGNSFVRLLRGDISLPVTYWVWGVLIGWVGLGVLLKELVVINYVDIVRMKSGFLIVQAFISFTVAYSVLILIATWRSAEKYKGATIWARLAQVSGALGVLALLGNVLSGFSPRCPDIGDWTAMMKKSLPTMVDVDTRWDAVSLKDQDMYFYYTLVNWSVASINIPKFKDAMMPKAKTACTDKIGRCVLNQGGHLFFVYRDQATNPVLKLQVTNADCNKP